MVRKSSLILCAIAACAAAPAVAQQAGAERSNPQIDFPGHVELASQVMEIRESRLLPLTRFQAMAAREDVLLLDARSAAAFAEGHIDGAINLPLPDFTAASLAETIGPDFDRPILIYCNNNFANNVAPVVRKIVTVALNIQTMINLHAYGYGNVYELGDVVDFNDPQVAWVAASDFGAD